MSLVLYRKYRPQNFSEVVGQEHVVKTLANGLASGIISHAYLFSGPRGSGKTTLARLLAKAFNCQNRKDNNSEPCNQCSSCEEIMGQRSIDLIEIDAASHRGIDEMRELRDGIKFGPTKSKYKVFIIDESHQLTKEAANALLKTLEEPPSHAIFILATTEIHKMIPTIISRCQRFDFRRLTSQEIIGRLENICKAEKVKIEKPALELIAVKSSGSARDAEGLLGQVLALGAAENNEINKFVSASAAEIKAEDIRDLLGITEMHLIADFCDLLLEKKSGEALNLINEIVESGKDVQEFVKSLINYLRQGIVLKIAGQETGAGIITGLTKEEMARLTKQAALFKEEELRRIINLFLEAENKIKYSSMPQLPLELAAIESCS